MGTNYYWLVNPCEHCNRAEKEIHIRKSSYGWCFGLHVYPEMDIMSLSDWENFWKKGNGYIVNEYKEKVSTEKMLDVIKNRLDYYSVGKVPLRHIELQRHFGKEEVWNGEGYWDCITEDFS